MRTWLLLPLFLFACETNDDTDDVADTDVDTDTETAAPDEANDLVGEWVDNWHGQHAVTADSWNSFGLVYTIASWDDADKWIVAQNDAEDPYNPSKWSRFDWAVVDGATYYCQTAFAAASQAEAETTAPADATNLAGGCGGFGWSGLRPVLADISGTWTDNWGGGHVVDAWSWESGDAAFAIVETHADDQWVVAQNDANNTYNPGLFSVFEWTLDGADLYYCQSSYDAASAAAAASATKADRGDLAAGCGGFGWSKLSAAR